MIQTRWSNSKKTIEKWGKEAVGKNPHCQVYLYMNFMRFNISCLKIVNVISVIGVQCYNRHIIRLFYFYFFFKKSLSHMWPDTLRIFYKRWRWWKMQSLTYIYIVKINHYFFLSNFLLSFCFTLLIISFILHNILMLFWLCLTERFQLQSLISHTHTHTQ